LTQQKTAAEYSDVLRHEHGMLWI